LDLGIREKVLKTCLHILEVEGILKSEAEEETEDIIYTT
jgi:DNA-binding transcriptional regulator PaaX